MYKFYREPNGGYLVIDTDTHDYFLKYGEDAYEGRASVFTEPNQEKPDASTGTISSEYLKDCVRVARKDVPKQWLKVLI